MIHGCGVVGDGWANNAESGWRESVKTLSAKYFRVSMTLYFIKTSRNKLWHSFLLCSTRGSSCDANECERHTRSNLQDEENSAHLCDIDLWAGVRAWKVIKLLRNINFLENHRFDVRAAWSISRRVLPFISSFWHRLSLWRLILYSFSKHADDDVIFGCE